MLTHRRQRYRIYPNATQREWMNRQFGACRFVWNMFLRLRVDAYALSKGEAVDLEPRDDDTPENMIKKYGRKDLNEVFLTIARGDKF